LIFDIDFDKCFTELRITKIVMMGSIRHLTPLHFPASQIEREDTFKLDPMWKQISCDGIPKSRSSSPRRHVNKQLKRADLLQEQLSHFCVGPSSFRIRSSRVALLTQ